MLVSIRYIVFLMYILDSDIVLYVFYIVIYFRIFLKFICMVIFMYCGIVSDFRGFGDGDNEIYIDMKNVF